MDYSLLLGVHFCSKQRQADAAAAAAAFAAGRGNSMDGSHGGAAANHLNHHLHVAGSNSTQQGAAAAAALPPPQQPVKSSGGAGASGGGAGGAAAAQAAGGISAMSLESQLSGDGLEGEGLGPGVQRMSPPSVTGVRNGVLAAGAVTFSPGVTPFRAAGGVAAATAAAAAAVGEDSESEHVRNFDLFNDRQGAGYRSQGPRAATLSGKHTV